MEENKRSWWQLLNAALWAGMFWMRLDSYNYLLAFHDELFSPEAWQKLQLEYLMMFCLYGCLVLLSLFRFFLYDRKAALLWVEAITTTLVCVLGSVGLLLLPTASTGGIIFLLLFLWALAIFEWYSLWKHYHPY